MEHLLKPLGRAALKKVQNATKNGVDINGKEYAEYTDSYKKWLKTQGYGEDKPRNMQLKGNLKKSIPMKIFTNEQANRVIVAPDKTKALNANNDFYPAHHLYDNPNNVKKGKRKWFFTDEELPTLLTDTNLLGDVYEICKKNLERELQKELKGKMRIIAGRKFEL